MATHTPTDNATSEKPLRMNFYGGDMPEADMTSVDWKSLDEETPPSVTRPWAPQHADEPGVDVDAAGRPRGRMAEGQPRQAPANSLQREEPKTGRKPKICK